MPNRDLDLLFEVGALRRVPRMWIHFFGPGMANNAEHSFRVAWIALVLAKREGKGDVEKILKMALVHDLDEGRTGDVNYLMRQYVERNKELAINDILDNTSLEKELLDVWQEYEERKTIEAKIVKDADSLDIDFELMEMHFTGHQLPDLWRKNPKSTRPRHYFTATAKRMFEELQKANPHDWHMRSRNRINAGGWAKAIPKAQRRAVKKRP